MKDAKSRQIGITIGLAMVLTVMFFFIFFRSFNAPAEEPAPTETPYEYPSTVTDDSEESSSYTDGLGESSSYTDDSEESSSYADDFEESLSDDASTSAQTSSEEEALERARREAEAQKRAAEEERAARQKRTLKERPSPAAPLSEGDYYSNPQDRSVKQAIESMPRLQLYQPTFSIKRRIQELPSSDQWNTWGDVEDFIIELLANKPPNRKYFSTSSGFAVVTAFEEIDKRGNMIESDTTQDTSMHAKSSKFGPFLQHLFQSPAPSWEAYRCFVFKFDNRGIDRPRRTFREDRDSMEERVDRGVEELPEVLRRLALDKQASSLEILIYEFGRAEPDLDMTLLTESKIDSLTHLRKAQIPTNFLSPE